MSGYLSSSVASMLFDPFYSKIEKAVIEDIMHMGNENA